eukprot:scaffold27942_cov59-Phaeocystis_antarctica.AAC.1
MRPISGPCVPRRSLRRAVSQFPSPHTRRSRPSLPCEPTHTRRRLLCPSSTLASLSPSTGTDFTSLSPLSRRSSEPSRAAAARGACLTLVAAAPLLGPGVKYTQQ